MWCMSDSLYSSYVISLHASIQFFAGPKEDLEEGMTTLSLAYAYEH